MADWPTTDELKKVLNVDLQTDNWTTELDSVMAAAIARVKQDVGDWDDAEDEPNDNLNRAAIRMAELMALRPEAAEDAANDPTYMRHLKGNRRRFAIS